MLKALCLCFSLFLASTVSAQRFPGGNSAVIALDTAAGSVCSATVIAPNAVLTARHCVMSRDMSQLLEAVEIRVQHLGTYYYGLELHAPSGNALSDDIAILVVRGRIPLTPATISRDPAFQGDPAVVVGYGVVPGIPPGVKSHIIVPIAELVLGMIVVPPAICRGDSGGPLLDGSGQVLGVASFIFSETPNPVCMEAPGAYVALFSHLPWVDYILTLASIRLAQ